MLHRHDFHSDIYTFSFLCEEGFRNIIGYLERMKAEFYPDWDELLAASKNHKAAETPSLNIVPKVAPISVH